MEKWKKFLAWEISIEIKACLYFAIILFYYFLYCILQGSFYASILCMVEIILTAYAVSYLQVYVLKNFDESECFSGSVIGKSLLCTAIYTTTGYILNWFDRNRIATLCFFAYMLLAYICVFLIYKIKRDFDTASLNRELEHFKKQRDNL